MRILRIGAAVFFGLATVVSVLVAVMFSSHGSIIDDMAAGRSPGDELGEAQAAAVFVILVGLLFAGVAMLLLAVWSTRAMASIERLTGHALRSDRIAISWIFPIVNLVAPFTSLRVAARQIGLDTDPIDRWQIGWVALVGLVAAAPFALGILDLDQRDAAFMLTAVAVLIAVVSAITAFLATLVMRRFERGIRDADRTAALD